MAKNKQKQKKRRRIVFLWFGSLAIIVVTTFTIGKPWLEIYDKYQEKKQLEIKLSKLKEKESVLKVDAKKLQDPDYIARYAREKYLYSKEGEIILRMPDE